jgi:hypothetical protein
VPIYQRDYSWTEEKWDDLWSDILTIIEADDQTHYMGAIVLQAQNDQDYTIIDGQQRLATLSLIALATIQNIQDLIDEGIDTAENIERKSLLISSYLGSKDAVSLNYSSKLFLNENNDSFYQTYLLQLRAPNNPHRLSASEKLMWDAYRYFYEKIKAHFAAAHSGEKLAAFINHSIAKRLVFIQITVENELNAYTVFETLNARGVELTITDLLKNYLLSVAARSQLDQKIAKDQWQRIIRITDLDGFPKFMRHFWNSRHKLVRKENLFKVVRNSIKTPTEAFEFLDQLEKSAAVYAALDNPNDELWTGNREIRKRVLELELFNVSQCYPLLLVAYEKLSLQDFERVLRLCVMISFRYNVIAGLNPNLQEEAYNQAALKLFAGELKTINQIAEAVKNIYPDDEQFHNAFAVKVLNTKRNKKLARYILYALENQLASTDRNFEDESGTIEHVLPENPSLEWETAFDEESQPDYIYRLGNLTLLESNKNTQECRNGTYDIKLPIYKTSQYRMTNSMDFPEWTPSQLRSRQAQLAKVATAIWRVAY